MKALTIQANGDLSVLKVQNVPDPAPEEGEVVIDVGAAACNHLDIWVRKGRPGLELEFPHVLGSDAAGTVAAVGGKVSHLREGDPVIINPGLNCGSCEFCLRGQQSECLYFGIVGMSRPGTFAEYVAVPAVNVYAKPEHLSDAEAAALPLAHLTAWRMLMSRAHLQPGETVLIHGIGGGVAIAGLQIAKFVQANVIVTSSSDEKLNRAAELGADQGINYAHQSDVIGAVLDLTDGRGVDVALDAVGAATWPINFGAVRRGGRIVHCGVTTGPEVTANIAALYWNHLTVMGSTMGSQEDFRQMVNTVRQAEMRPVIDSVYSLDDSRQAIERMERGEQFGKLVIAKDSGNDSDVGALL